MNIVKINNKDYEICDNDLELSLLEFIRERAFLTGTKNGCEKGLCGSCTVVMNGKAIKSCRTKMSKTIGCSIITIEGMEYPDGKLHPIQKAFVDLGAIQCGFCTPGMVMSAYALLLANKNPTREEIQNGMKANLCRCTGYQQIIDAVELASKIINNDGLPIEAGCLK